MVFHISSTLPLSHTPTQLGSFLRQHSFDNLRVSTWERLFIHLGSSQEDSVAKNFQSCFLVHVMKHKIFYSGGRPSPGQAIRQFGSLYVWWWLRIHSTSDFCEGLLTLMMHFHPEKPSQLPRRPVLVLERICGLPSPCALRYYTGHTTVGPNSKSKVCVVSLLVKFSLQLYMYIYRLTCCRGRCLAAISCRTGFWCGRCRRSLWDPTRAARRATLDPATRLSSSLDSSHPKERAGRNDGSTFDNKEKTKHVFFYCNRARV